MTWLIELPIVAQLLIALASLLIGVVVLSCMVELEWDRYRDRRRQVIIAEAERVVAAVEQAQGERDVA